MLHQDEQQDDDEGEVFDDCQDSIERLQNQSETAGGAKTNIANTIKLNRSDDDEGEGHVNSVNSEEKGVDRAGQFCNML